MDLLYQVVCVILLFGCVLAETITVTLNHPQKITCNYNKVIEIDNITVTQQSIYTDCQRDSCNVTAWDNENIQSQCNGYNSCNITSNLQTNCLKDYGFYSFNYTLQDILPFSCDFDNDECGWKVENGSSYAWTIQKREMPSYATRSTTRHIFETSMIGTAVANACKGSVNDTTNLVSGDIKPGVAKCLSFRYFSFGEHVDNLRVYQNFHSIWSSSRSTENNVYIELDLQQDEKYKIFFEAQRTAKSNGYIAVDDIVISEKSCQERKHLKKTCLNVKENEIIQADDKEQIQIDQSSFTFYPRYEKCFRVYDRVKRNIKSACSSIHKTNCDLNLSNSLGKNPGCFMPNKLTIEYTCKAHPGTRNGSESTDSNNKDPGEIGRESQSEDGHDKSYIGGVLAAVVVLICVVAVLLVIFRRSRNGQRKIKTINNLQENDVEVSLTGGYRSDYPGNQGISLPNQSALKTQQVADGSDGLQDNTTEDSGQTRSHYDYVDSEELRCSKTHGHENMKDKYSTSTVKCVNSKSKYSMGIEDHSTSKTTEEYTILNPNETGFNRSHVSRNVTSQDDKSKHAKSGNVEIEDTNDQTYDTSNIKGNKEEIETNIYSHTIDSVYDTTSHTQGHKDKEDTYDHFVADNGVLKDDM